MSAYCFFDILEVTDAEKMEAYRAGVVATVHQYGGRYVVIGGPLEVVEGHWQPAFPVMLEFPSLAEARRWYQSPEYEPLKALRLAATRGNAVFMDAPSVPH
ncbi:MAG: DUF1330 domain-containing protein [Opitutaceae bacterium]|nr:DUF1330 domain-containing protein [Opitutaceae bacterium]